jgi:hypothetical protein
MGAPLHCSTYAGGGGFLDDREHGWVSVMFSDVVRSWLRLQSPIDSSHIQIMYIKSILAPLYAVDGHMGAPLHCSTCAGGGGFLDDPGHDWVFSDV